MFDFTGYGENILTFKTEEADLSGKPVDVTADGTVGIAGDGKAFCGIAHGVRGKAAAVQLSGYAVLPYSGSAPAYGTASLVADGEGGVKAADGGKTVTVLKIDTENATVGFIF